MNDPRERFAQIAIDAAREIGCSDVGNYIARRIREAPAPQEYALDLFAGEVTLRPVSFKEYTCQPKK
jgi:hypothetical protein